jgi:predicted GIY-YIG superfamily endonuclease
MKYVYLIQSLENGYYKIGVSKHPQKRINELKTGNSSPLKLISVFKSEFPYQIEKAMQRKYQYLNKEGEWFDLSIANEIFFQEECEKIENTIKILKQNNNIFI